MSDNQSVRGHSCAAMSHSPLPFLLRFKRWGDIGQIRFAIWESMLTTNVRSILGWFAFTNLINGHMAYQVSQEISIPPLISPVTELTGFKLVLAALLNLI